MATQPRRKIRAPKIMSIAYAAIWRAFREGYAARTKIGTPENCAARAVLTYGFF